MTEPPRDEPSDPDDRQQYPTQPQYEPPSYGAGQYGRGQYDPGPYEQGQYSQGQYSQGQYSQGQYEQGQYGQDQYGRGPYGEPQYGAPSPYQPPAPAQGVSVGRLLGARAWQRPEARFGPALAGAGGALVVIGAFVWSAGYLAAGFGLDFGDSGTSGTHGTGRRFFGFGLFLVLTVLGYLVLATRRRGPLTTTATVATLVGVPATLGFVTLDIDGLVQRGEYPINFDLVYLGSILIYLISYFAVPGARGRAVYLAVAALQFPGYLAIKVTGLDSLRSSADIATGGTFGAFSVFDAHTGALTALALIFGLAYYVIGVLLDRSGRYGVAVAMMYPAFITTVAGFVVGASTFKQSGTGVLLIIVGGALSFYGGRYGRRFTAWVWAAGAALGVLLLVTKINGDDAYVTAGILLIIVGLIFAAIGSVAGRRLDENSEDDAPAPGQQDSYARRH